MGIEAATVQETYLKMKEKLSKVVPDVELKIKAELVYEINRRKKEKGAVILGHNYMEPALFHTVPDYVGDSLELSRLAAKTEASPIIFCGVRFMAETAKILNPTKTVLLPAKVAGCSLASSITAADIRKLKEMYPGAPVITYINTYADVKAETDICCTSGNAAKVVQSLSDEVIIFLPDQYLGSNVANETGRRFILPPEQADTSRGPVMVGWKGRCEVHEQFTVDDIVQIRKQFPGVSVLTHPECSPEVVAASDISSSTSKMITHVRESKAPHFLILTECSMADNIIAENQDKDILRMCSIRCPHMNEITLEDTLRALEFNEVVIEVDPVIAARAKKSLDRMLEIR
jgi:quinolinate synthase